MDLNHKKQSIPELPHHIEAERSILGTVLLNNLILPQILERGLEPRDFYAVAHQRIFESILCLFEVNSPIDLITLNAQLRNRGLIEESGGSSTLTGLLEDSFSLANVLSYVDLVKEKAIVRRLIQVATEITTDALASGKDSEDLLDEVERKIFSIAQNRKKKTSSTLRDVFLGNLQTIENLSLNKSEVIGMPTGFKDFDQLTGGLRAGQLMILAARPAMGKTSMFLNIVQNVVNHDQNAVVMIFSLEMAEDELGFRILSGSTKIPASRLKTGSLSSQDWSKLLESSKTLSHSKVHIDDEAELTMTDVKARCRRVLAQEKRLDLVVIDYLQLIKGSRNSQRNDSNREREVSEISRGLKSLAKELKVPVIALSQLNRSLEARPNKRPILSDLRESGSIEADADIVAFIYRDEVYNRETEHKGDAELIIAKHRAGPTDTVYLKWIPHLTLFTNREKLKGVASPILASIS